MHLNSWQKVLVFVLSILIVPFLTFWFVFEALISTSGQGAGDGAAIVASAFGLPVGIILGIILPFIRSADGNGSGRKFGKPSVLSL